MGGAFRRLVFLYLLFVLAKLLLSSFIPAPSALSDDYVYAKMAQSFHDSLEFSVHGVLTHQYPPLYPVLLSFSYVFDGMMDVYFFMKLLNVLVSSLVIFPVFLLAREFLSERRSLLVAVLASLLPSNFAFSGYLLAENLFYPLFMFSAYSIYKSFVEGSLWWDFFAGLSVGLTVLARVSGLVLLPLVFFILVARLFLKPNLVFEVKKKLFMLLVFVLTVLPWVVSNVSLFGFSISGILGSYSVEFSEGRVTDNFTALLPFFTWVFSYIGYLALASGFVFFVFSLFCFRKLNTKDPRLFTFVLTVIFSSVLSIFMVSNHNASSNLSLSVVYKTFIPWLTGRLMGRYLDHVLPLILISGFIGFSFYERARDKGWLFLKYSLFAIPFVLLFLNSIFFPLFPVNNISLAYIGVLKYALDYLLFSRVGVVSLLVFSIFVLLFFASVFILALLSHNLKLKHLFLSFAIFFLLIGFLNYSVNYYNSDRYWYKGSQMQFGLWVNDNIKQRSVFLFDEDDGCKIEKLSQGCIYEGFADNSSVSVMGFWMNHGIVVGNVSDFSGYDYVVTKKRLGLPLVYENSNIYLYKAEGVMP